MVREWKLRNGIWMLRVGAGLPRRWVAATPQDLVPLDNELTQEEIQRRQELAELAEDLVEEGRQWAEEGASQRAAQREEEREERMLYQEQYDRDCRSHWWAMHDHATAAWAAQNVQVAADTPAPAGHVLMSFSPAGKD
jgi:hypothetical protein